MNTTQPEAVEAGEMSQGADEDDVEGEADGKEEDVDGQVEAGAEKAKRKRREAALLEREEGKSVFPFSRVQKIMKADRDLPTVAKEATFLISLATEEFIKRFAQAIQRVADKERRATIQQRDVATVVHKVDEFTFLEELLGWHTFSQTTKSKRKPKALEEEKKKKNTNAEPTMLDLFVGKTGDGNEGDVVMNEDGTMGMDPDGNSAPY